MLEELFPRSHSKYRSLALLGPMLDDFGSWLRQCGYTPLTVRAMLKPAPILEKSLRSRRVRQLSDLGDDVLEACWQALRRRRQMLGGVVRALARYLDAHELREVVPRSESTPSGEVLGGFEEYLCSVRGCSQSTVRNHVRTASEILAHLDFDESPDRLATIDQNDIERFVCVKGRSLSRASLQQVVAHVRCFLRYLAGKGQVPVGLDSQIDTPRLYRLEQLPRALPWETVTALLQSIDRTTSLGLRDHAILFLIATYGLRCCEIVTLALDDIDWRKGALHIQQRKTGSYLGLPLTDAVRTVLVRYLRDGRVMHVACRELFLRTRAPIGPLGPTAVSMIFERRAAESGLEIPFFGAHCLRHSYAVHLMRRGVALKTLGDLLGHRNAESTQTYLRLATEDLRGVALPLVSVPAGMGERS